MRERDHEINQRRQRRDKRAKLRKKMQATTEESKRKVLEQKIRKTIPRFTLPE